MPRSVLAILLALGLLAPGPALGHADLQTVEPTPDGTRLVFGAPVEAQFLRVTDADGREVRARVDDRDPHAVVVASSKPLRWRLLSRDGHVGSGRTDGAEAVSTRERLGAVVLGVSRLLLGVGIVLVGGLLVARRLVLDPAAREIGEPAPDGGRALAMLGAWCMLSGVVAAWVGQGIALDALADPSLAAETRWGRAWLVQAVCAAIVLVSVVASRRRAVGVAGLAAVVAAGAGAWAGHAGSQADGGLSIWFEIAHAVATIAWIGALAALAVVVWPAVRVGDRTALALGGAVIVRFSLLATVSVGVLVVTGTYRALAELSGPGALLDTGYGAALLAKLAIFAMMLGVAALNRFVAHPRLERGGLGVTDDDGGAIALLRRTVVIELGLALALIASVAVLASLAPA